MLLPSSFTRCRVVPNLHDRLFRATQNEIYWQIYSPITCKKGGKIVTETVILPSSFELHRRKSVIAVCKDTGWVNDDRILIFEWTFSFLHLLLLLLHPEKISYSFLLDYSPLMHLYTSSYAWDSGKVCNQKSHISVWKFHIKDQIIWVDINIHCIALYEYMSIP